MIILKEKLDGYNNVLTQATKSMKFGVNNDINYVEPTVPTVLKEIAPTVSTVPWGTTNSEKNIYLFGTTFILAYRVVRYVL